MKATRRVIFIELGIALGAALVVMVVLIFALVAGMANAKYRNAVEAVQTAFTIVYVAQLEAPQDGYLVYYEDVGDVAAVESFAGAVYYARIENGALVSEKNISEPTLTQAEDGGQLRSVLTGYGMKYGIGMAASDMDYDLTRLHVSYYVER